MDYNKLKSFCIAKETINKTKKQPVEWKIFARHISDKGLMQKIYKYLILVQVNRRNKNP